MAEVEVLVVVVAGLDVVVAGLDAVVVVVVEVAGLVADFGAAVGLCAKATEAAAQRSANVFNKCVGLMVNDLVETNCCPSSSGFALFRRFYLFSKASRGRAEIAALITEESW
jgi:hypothetical protein